MSTLVGSSFLAIATILGHFAQSTAHSNGHAVHNGNANHGLTGHSHGSHLGHGADAGNVTHIQSGNTSHTAHGVSSTHGTHGTNGTDLADGSTSQAQAGHSLSNGGSRGTAGHSLLANSDNGAAASISEPSGIITRSLGRMHRLHIETKEENIIQSILGWINPLSISIFMTFFGLTGAILSLELHALEIISLPLAIFMGWAAVQALIRLIGWLAQNMRSSSEAKEADLVGRIAEVTVPISQGKTGEITYIINSKRYSSPAKSLDESRALTKRTKVMICELNGPLLLVEPWTDPFIDPQLDSPRYP